MQSNAIEANKIYNDDCLDVMKSFEDDSIDLIVTDPPYGYSFMGKDWDKAVPSVEIWQECLRVLKAGSFAFVMSAPRSDVQGEMISRLQQAGFNLAFTPIYWAYASGFPKAMNISKAADKKLGFERNRIDSTGNLHEASISHGWSQHKQIGDMPNNNALSFEAQSLEGSYAGFQPKPAVEVIIVAMKPLSEKNYINQALANKKGITWLDDGRIPYISEEDLNEVELQHKSFNGKLMLNPLEGWNANSMIKETHANQQGRFPANLLVSDDVLNDGNMTISKDGNQLNRKDKPFMQRYANLETSSPEGYNDSGSFSRYFSLDMWFQKQIEQLPESVRKTFPFLIVPKASRNEKNKGVEKFPDKKINGVSSNSYLGLESDGLPKTTTKNFHPTVKPVDLFSYLITIGSRSGDIVLDPFAGSGTAAVACRLTGRQFIMIEREKEFCDIMKARKDIFPITLWEAVNK